MAQPSREGAGYRRAGRHRAGGLAVSALGLALLAKVALVMSFTGFSLDEAKAQVPKILEAMVTS